MNKKTNTSVPVFQDQLSLGILRGDIFLGSTGPGFPFVWLLTQDSKASTFTRLLFAMRPWYASEPRGLEEARVLTVNDPVAVSRLGAIRTARNPRRRMARPACGAQVDHQVRAVARAFLG